MWVIRGGDQDELVGPFVDEGVIGLRYPQVPDAEILTHSEIRSHLTGDHTTAQLDALVDVLTAFVRQLDVGNSILLTDASRDEVVVGTVTGRYEYRGDGADGAQHLRTVDWLTRHPISDLPSAVQGTVRHKLALHQDRSAEWAAYLAQVKDGTIGRHPADRPVRAVATPRKRTASERKAPAAPRIKKPVVAQQTCQSCFLQTHPDRIHDGICEDCGG
jgi:predicted Mrr-cat superfamily restriction endonuclease